VRERRREREDRKEERGEREEERGEREEERGEREERTYKGPSKARIGRICQVGHSKKQTATQARRPALHAVAVFNVVEM